MIYVESSRRVDYFLRFVDALAACGYEALFVTSRLTFYIRLRRIARTVLLHPVNRPDTRLPPDLSLYQNVDLIVKAQSLDQANYIASHILPQVDFLIRKIEPEQLWLWNGLSTSALVLAYAAQRSGVETRFFELSNLPGKTFVDPCGANALSSIATESRILDALVSERDEKDFAKWMKLYLVEKKTPPPQATTVRKFYYWLYPIDVLCWNLGLGLRDDYRSMLTNVRRKIIARRMKALGSKCELSGPYIFFPLQVSRDTNVRIHSDIDNLAALEIAISVATTKKCRLLTKLHPAEPDADFANEVFSFCQTRSDVVSLVTNDTLSLLAGSESVITINSTAGLEGLILGKKVLYLGRSHYKAMNRARLMAYVLRYLVNIDPFSKMKCDVGQVTSVLERSRMADPIFDGRS